ncbi:MAG: rsfS, partial [Roseomonas sp.]|nr:rsfS [Roseomonas sp.]
AKPATRAPAARSAAPKLVAPKRSTVTPTKKPAAATAKAPKAAAPKVKRVKLSPPQIDRLVQATVASLEDDKAENIVVLDVASRSAFADRMVIATGLVERQIQAMAFHIEKALAELGLKRLRTETSPDWVLLDAGDLVIHLFKPEARDNYRLEKMWGPDSPMGMENAMPRPGEAETRNELPPEIRSAESASDFSDDDLVIEGEDSDEGADDEEDEGDEG